MLRKLIGNDLRNHVFLSVVTTLFMAICAMLLALTIMLFLNLSGAIDSLMEQAQTPDFLQMHAGEIDREALERFVEGRQDVEQWQVCGFLNLENGIIRLGEKTLEDSTQDNGLCVQGSGFDYLLDMENRLPDVRDGQNLCAGLLSGGIRCQGRRCRMDWNQGICCCGLYPGFPDEFHDDETAEPPDARAVRHCGCRSVDSSGYGARGSFY